MGKLVAAYSDRLQKLIKKKLGPLIDAHESGEGFIDLMWQPSHSRGWDKAEQDIQDIIDDEVGSVAPVKVHFKPAKHGGWWLSISDAMVGESKDQLLAMMAHEIVRGFQYAEEAYFQDQGKRPPYTLKVGNGAGKCSIDMKLDPTVSSASGVFTTVQKRLIAYVHEYLNEHILKPRVEATRTFGQATIHLYLDKLKEELSPNDFAEKVAQKLMDMMVAEVKERAPNTAKFELDRYLNGVPRITAVMQNRQALSKAAVERIMMNITSRELPVGNLLGLSARYGSLGSANGSRTKIRLAIKPANDPS